MVGTDAAMSLSVRQPSTLLVCQVGSRLCGLPLGDVVETMRALPCEALAESPHFVRGVSVIRGEVVPVVDVASLLGLGKGSPTRFVTITVEGRGVALAVDAVLGVEVIPDAVLHDLPPLVEGASGDVIAAIGALDAELLVVLRSARLVPESVGVFVHAETSAP